MPLSYPADFQPQTQDFLIKLLQNNAGLIMLIAKRVAAENQVGTAQPIYPMVTLNCVGLGGDPGIDEIDFPIYTIEISSKKNSAECWAIYVLIRKLLHNKNFETSASFIEKVTEIWKSDSVFSRMDQTWKLTARYRAAVTAKTITVP